MSPFLLRHARRGQGEERRVYTASAGSLVVHDNHGGLHPHRWFGRLADAEAEGYRACRSCRPS